MNFWSCTFQRVRAPTLGWVCLQIYRANLLLSETDFTTNTVEGFHRQLRKVAKTKGAFTAMAQLEFAA